MAILVNDPCIALHIPSGGANPHETYKATEALMKARVPFHVKSQAEVIELARQHRLI